MLSDVSGRLVERLDRGSECPGAVTGGGRRPGRVAHRHRGGEQSAERCGCEQDRPRERVGITVRAGEVEQLQGLGGAGDPPLQQREHFKVAVARGAVEDRADRFPELGRAGTASAGVLLGRERVAFRCADRTVRQREINAGDALINADANSEAAQRLDNLIDRRDRRQLLISAHVHQIADYPASARGIPARLGVGEPSWWTGRSSRTGGRPGEDHAMTESDSSQAASVYQLRAVSPLIWRRLLVPGDATLADLHAVLQAAFAWSDVYLHRLNVHGREYHGIYESREVRLSDLGLR